MVVEEIRWAVFETRCCGNDLDAFWIRLWVLGIGGRLCREGKKLGHTCFQNDNRKSKGVPLVLQYCPWFISARIRLEQDKTAHKSHLVLRLRHLWHARYDLLPVLEVISYDL